MNTRAAQLAPFAFAVALATAGTAACTDPEGPPVDFASMELTVADLPASPSNAAADNPRAAALGQALFFDRSLSSDGTIGCVSCHDPARGFSDARPFSIGVRGQTGDRHAMPITAAAMHPFLLWDGKADSAWSQPLKALENSKEMDFTRVEVARVMVDRYRDDYEAVFGPLPDLSAAPPRAKPGDAAWDAMSFPMRDDVQRVFANAGKAIEAYERKVLCTNTRFDRSLRGEETLTAAERAGRAIFERERCAGCHSGPSFSDGKFHNLGLPSPDRGRVLGAAALLSDPFSGAGAYSDDRAAGEAKLATLAAEPAQEGAFRTASLRGIAQRTFFGHASHEQSLRGFLLDVYRGQGGGGDGAGGGNGNGRGGDDGRGGAGAGAGGATVGVRDPLLQGVNVNNGDVDDLVAFLSTLNCPPLPPKLVRPR